MNLKRFKQLLQEDREGFDDIYDDDFYYGDEDEESLYDKDAMRFDDDEDEYLGDNDVLENLATLIRQMIKTAGISDYYVTTNNYDISIQFVFNKTEKLNKVLKVMGLLKKLYTDTLIQFESELDLWQTKDGSPLLTVDFYYSDNVKGKYKAKDVPF